MMIYLLIQGNVSCIQTQAQQTILKQTSWYNIPENVYTFCKICFLQRPAFIVPLDHFPSTMTTTSARGLKLTSFFWLHRQISLCCWLRWHAKQRRLVSFIASCSASHRNPHFGVSFPAHPPFTPNIKIPSYQPVIVVRVIAPWSSSNGQPVGAVVLVSRASSVHILTEKSIISKNVAQLIYHPYTRSFSEDRRDVTETEESWYKKGKLNQCLHG